MDKKIFAVLLLGILLVTPFASAGFGTWISNTFRTSEQKMVQITESSGDNGGGSGPILITEDPMPITDSGSGSVGGSSGAVYLGYLNTQKILAEGEEIRFAKNGKVEFAGIGDDQTCLFHITFSSNGNNSGAAALILEKGEIRVIEDPRGELILGVTATTDGIQDDYCSVVMRFHGTEPTSIEENPTPDTDEETTSDSGQAPIF